MRGSCQPILRLLLNFSAIIDLVMIQIWNVPQGRARSLEASAQHSSTVMDILSCLGSVSRTQPTLESMGADEKGYRPIHPIMNGGNAKQLHHWERVVHHVAPSSLVRIYMMGSTLASQHYSTAVFCWHFFASILVKASSTISKKFASFSLWNSTVPTHRCYKPLLLSGSWLTPGGHRCPRTSEGLP